MTETSVSRVTVKFEVEDLGDAKGELIRYLAPRTIETLLKKMPLEGRAVVWKQQVYFEVPVKIGDEKSKPKVEKGTIAFWPMGSALCVFFGESQPYSPVNVLGRITENLELFEKVKNGAKIKVELL